MTRPKFQQPSEGSAIVGGQENGGQVEVPESGPKKSAPNPEIQAMAGKPVETPEDPTPVQAAELTAQLEAALADSAGSGEGGPEAEQLANEALEDVGEPEQNVERREARASQPWRSVKTSEATARLGSLTWRPSRTHTSDTHAYGKFASDALIIGIPAGLLIWGATFLSPIWIAPVVVGIVFVAFLAIVSRLLKYFK